MPPPPAQPNHPTAATGPRRSQAHAQHRPTTHAWQPHQSQPTARDGLPTPAGPQPSAALQHIIRPTPAATKPPNPQGSAGTRSPHGSLCRKPAPRCPRPLLPTPAPTAPLTAQLCRQASRPAEGPGPGTQRQGSPRKAPMGSACSYSSGHRGPAAAPSRASEQQSGTRNPLKTPTRGNTAALSPPTAPHTHPLHTSAGPHTHPHGHTDTAPHTDPSAAPPHSSPGPAHGRTQLPTLTPPAHTRTQPSHSPSAAHSNPHAPHPHNRRTEAPPHPPTPTAQTSTHPAHPDRPHGPSAPPTPTEPSPAPAHGPQAPGVPIPPQPQRCPLPTWQPAQRRRRAEAEAEAEPSAGWRQQHQWRPRAPGAAPGRRGGAAELLRLPLAAAAPLRAALPLRPQLRRRCAGTRRAQGQAPLRGFCCSALCPPRPPGACRGRRLAAACALSCASASCSAPPLSARGGMLEEFGKPRSH
ncbi:uncharacterized protein LOC135174236 isoform X1 [Pogoniulus pusillus]|uniref:uncharacterized protein LOC135174236 isoform X1 n=1 Tax=Pogoniulus pusillus TaxID=488313 RepID=UPI0030B9A992